MNLYSSSLSAQKNLAPSASQEDRVKQIARCVQEIHRCETELHKDKDGTAAWLGYMDWLEELHFRIWEHTYERQ